MLLGPPCLISAGYSSAAGEPDRRQCQPGPHLTAMAFGAGPIDALCLQRFIACFVLGYLPQPLADLHQLVFSATIGEKPIMANTHQARYALRRITGFHRIRHYGLIANTTRKDNLARARELLMSEQSVLSTEAETTGTDTADSSDPDEQPHATYVCPDCGAPMFIIDTFLGGQLPRAPPTLSGGRP